MRPGGQSLVEFALVLPLFLAFLGIVADVARVYGDWLRLEAVTRASAELIASDPTYQFASNARPVVEGKVCTAMTGSASCPVVVRVPTVELVYTTMPGTSTAIWRGSVATEYDFHSFLIYPFVTALTGSSKWTIRSSSSFEIIRRPVF